MPARECIVSVESMNIFPVGWCETNGYQLRPPRRAVGMNNTITIIRSDGVCCGIDLIVVFQTTIHTIRVSRQSILSIYIVTYEYAF